MFFPQYLALTPTEFRNNVLNCFHAAWMSCHFSAAGDALCDLPDSVPKESVLILDDRTPMSGQNPQKVAEILGRYIVKFSWAGILLDFQQKGNQEEKSLAKLLTASISCPVGVSEQYASDLRCPVFLSPIPLHIPPEKILSQWENREKWLDITLCDEILTVTADGITSAFRGHSEKSCPFYAKELYCHYRTELKKDSAVFIFHRSAEDQNKFQDAVEKLGVTKTFGLWQEFRAYL